MAYLRHPRLHISGVSPARIAPRPELVLRRHVVGQVLSVALIGRQTPSAAARPPSAAVPASLPRDAREGLRVVGERLPPILKSQCPTYLLY
jgi:hypothetical protein